MSGKLMRAGCCVVAILCVLIIGRLTVPEPVPRIERVKEPVMIQVPAPAQPQRPSGINPERRRATLEDVRRDWNIEGRLSCVVLPR